MSNDRNVAAPRKKSDVKSSVKPCHFVDHVVAMPLHPEARAAMVDNLDLVNPSGQYATAHVAKKVLEESREEVVELLGADPIEVVFTSGGMEVDNLAVSGLYFKAAGSDIVVSPTEHDAVLKTRRYLEKEHWARIVSAPMDASGRVDLEAFPALNRSSTTLVTCMWADSETGAVQSVSEISVPARKARVPSHIDTVQATGHVPIDFHTSGTVAMTISAHKFGGPRGIGALLAHRGITLCPHNSGGGQERGLWSGTRDVISVAGMAAGLRAAISEMRAEHDRVKDLAGQLTHAIAGTERATAHTTQPALVGHVYANFPGAEADSLIMFFDAADVDCSTGSVCNAGVNRPSHAFSVMGVSEFEARSAIRSILGWTPAQNDVDAVTAALPDTAI